LLNALLHLRPPGRVAHVSPPHGILGIDPRRHLGAVQAFEPTVIVNHVHAVIGVRDGPLRCGGFIAGAQYYRCRQATDEANRSAHRIASRAKQPTTIPFDRAYSLSASEIEPQRGSVWQPDPALSPIVYRPGASPRDSENALQRNSPCQTSVR